MINIRPVKGILGAAAVLATALTFTLASPADARRSQDMPRAEIKKIIVQEAMNTSVPASLALAVAKIESDFQPQALSGKGARGVMQIMPATGLSEWGVEADELWDPRLNIRLGIDFLERLIERYDGDWELALSYYNGGSAVGKPGNARVLPWTREYVDAVLRWERRYATQNRVWLAVVEREAKTGMGNQTPRFGDEDDHKPASWSKRRRRVTWSGPARPRIREIREPRKSKRRARRWSLRKDRVYTPRRKRGYTTRDDFTKGSLKDRLKAARRSLDDFS